MGILVVLKSWLQKIKGTENVVQFLSGSEALPPAVFGEEEAEMLHRLEAGEDEEHIKAQLIEHNLRLVVYISQKFENTGVDKDDLISIRHHRAHQGDQLLPSDKNIKLATYASRCIENEILMYLRRTSKLKSEVSFDEPSTPISRATSCFYRIFSARTAIPCTGASKAALRRSF